jgi:polyribonucleotide nucleotidyltransferase
MDATLSTARAAISTYAPRLYKLTIPTDKIRDLIGPGGKKIKSIIEATGVKIDVHEDGTVHIFSTSGSGGDAALADGARRYGKRGNRQDLPRQGGAAGGVRGVRRTLPGTDGLLHISEISEHRIRDVRDELKLGDQVLVKVLSIEGNKVRLSRKALIKEAREKAQKKEAAGAGGSAE